MRSAAKDKTVGGFLFPGDTEHLVSVAFDVVQGVTNNDCVTGEVFFYFELDFASDHFLFVGV